MDSTAPTNIADYLAQFASAVVPLHDFHVFPDVEDEPNSFNIFLNEGSTFIFTSVDDEGNFGMILYFDDIKVPQGENLFDLQVILHLPFDDFKIMETLIAISYSSCTWKRRRPRRSLLLAMTTIWHVLNGVCDPSCLL